MTQIIKHANRLQPGLSLWIRSITMLQAKITWNFALFYFKNLNSNFQYKALSFSTKKKEGNHGGWMYMESYCNPTILSYINCTVTSLLINSSVFIAISMHMSITIVPIPQYQTINFRKSNINKKHFSCCSFSSLKDNKTTFLFCYAGKTKLH